MQLCRLDPAYPPNAPISELRTPELLVLASVRLWAAPHRDPTATHPDWRGNFVAAGVEAAGAPAFDAFCRILATAAQMPLDVRCTRCGKRSMACC